MFGISKGPPPIVYLLGLLALGSLGFFSLRNGVVPGQPTPPEPVSTATFPPFFRLVPEVPSGIFNYGGSTTFAPIRLHLAPEVAAVWPEFQLRYIDPIDGKPGSGAGIRMLLRDQLAFAQSSRPLRPEEYEEARQRGFALEAIPVALDGIVAVVHPSLGVQGMTVAQLRGIYTGTITNWQQIGGPNLTIVPFSRDPNAGGTVGFFVEDVLGDEALASTVRLMSSTTLALRAIAQTPGGIYYASAPAVIGQCQVKPLALGRVEGNFVSPFLGDYVPPDRCPAQRNQLNPEVFRSGDYPITRRLFIVVKRNGQSDEQAGQTYANVMLTDQGQAMVTAAGFVPIR